MSALTISQVSLRDALPLPDLLGDLVTLAFQYRFVRAMWMVSLVVVLYDYFLTLGDEVEFLWKGKFNFPRLLFFVCRYWPAANLILDNIILAWDHPSDRACFIWYNWIIYAGVLSRLVVGLILLLRVHAMFGRNKTMFALLLVLLTVAVSGEVVIAGIITARLESITLPKGYPGCAPTNIQTWAWTFWLPVLFFEVPLFLLAVIKSIQVARGEQTSSRIMFILLRDSVMFFGIVLAVILTNCIIWASQSVGLFSAFPSALFAVQGILGSRMLLHIKQATRPRYPSPGISHPPTSFSALQFATAEIIEPEDIMLSPNSSSGSPTSTRVASTIRTV